MKTTVELPDELMRTVKVQAAKAGRKLKDVMAELIRAGLSREPVGVGATHRQVRLPLVNCAREARPGQEMTPDGVAEVLAQEEAGALRRS